MTDDAAEPEPSAPVVAFGGGERGAASDGGADHEATWAAPPADRIGRVLAIAGVIALAAYGLARPGSVLTGGLSWLVFLVFAASGWGYLVARIAKVVEPELGLRAAWGLAGYLAASGPLVAFGVCSRPVLLVLLGIGLIGFAWREWTTPAPCIHVARAGIRYLRAQPALGALAIVLGVFAVVQIVGGVAALDRNPWDDDIAYTPLIKRLLDAGDLVEPFSFRRLSAYGGQTVLGALGAARGSLANVHLIDKGLCFAIALLMLVGFARERRTAALWTTILALVVLLLPDTSINTAAQWSGVVMFVALYRTVDRGHWGLVGLVGAATCTLRQNYIAVVVLFVGIVLVFRLITNGRDERRTVLRVIVVAVGAILMWWIAAFVSSRTFLFPMIEGTWNHSLSLKPEVMSWADELQYMVWACIETTPLTIVPVLFALLAFTHDVRAGRPLRALFVAATLGFLLLVHGFAGTDPFHIWRYAFGFAIALTMIFVIEIGVSEESGDLRLVKLGRWLLLAALVVQILGGRAALPKRFATIATDIREASAIGTHGDPVARVDQRRYEAMQAVIPPGARVAIMLDDPAFLDFARNMIANLDTPGFASPGSQLPSFQGAEAIRSYLVEQGYRYLAFVRSDRSRYFYRRPFWLWRLYNDSELFAAMSAYAIDMIDSFAELATTAKVLYDIDGLVVLDLGAPTLAGSPPTPAGSQASRRDSFVRALSDREKLHDAWSLTTRSDLRFEDGIAALQFADGGVDDPAWFEIVRPRATEGMRGTAMRPIYRRAHLRVRAARSQPPQVFQPGATPTAPGSMRLVLRAAIALRTTHTRPRLDIALDGEPLTSAVADEEGRYTVDVVVPGRRLRGGWHDLYLVLSTSAEPQKDVRDPRVARLEVVEWTPVP